MPLENIFRAYDIRGETDELTPGVMARIGRALATQVDGPLLLGRDVRPSSPDLAAAFADGLVSSGVDVYDAGLTPYGPVLHASMERSLPSVYVTASHLPTGWNGVKFSHAGGSGFTAAENAAVKQAFFAEAFDTGSGELRETTVIDGYMDALLDRVAMEEVSVLLDCGNGAASVVAPELFEQAGATVTTMHAELDGTFPNRSSDVTEETLTALKDRMKTSTHDVGIAFDGDADRCAAVDDAGRLLTSEQLAAILLQDAVNHHDGPVVANVSCSRLIDDVAARFNRDVHRVRVGHTYLFNAMAAVDACLGVESSGHMAVSHVLPLNDGIAPALSLAAVVARMEKPLSAAVDALPSYHRDRRSFSVPDAEKFAVIEQLQEQLSQKYAETSTLDGIRVELDEGWALIRASNTSPKIRLTVEAETAAGFNELQETFSAALDGAISS